ncbi:MAG TPA: M23 family metallopeptidase [Methylomirabilota bacterium]|nr:M23 family metallopeptidase [Methylomirabilota bacterium]
MNLFKALFLANTFWSFRKELTFISLTFLMVLLLPIFAAISLTHVGINGISDTLVKFDASTSLIKLFYPNGSLYKEISINSNWPAFGVVTLEFGESDLPYQPLHTGIDIAGRTGDPVTTFMKGKVTYVGDLSWGYGKHIIIDNGDNVSSLYAHLSEVNVKVGQDVKSGDVIGLEGSTGWSTGPHVHFEIRVFGIPVNPKLFISGNP